MPFTSHKPSTLPSKILLLDVRMWRRCQEPLPRSRLKHLALMFLQHWVIWADSRLLQKVVMNSTQKRTSFQTKTKNNFHKTVYMKLTVMYKTEKANLQTKREKNYTCSKLFICTRTKFSFCLHAFRNSVWFGDL